MGLVSGVAAALHTTLNLLLYLLSGGRYLWLEGRLRKGQYKNWGHRFTHTPSAFLQPDTEAGIIAAVRDNPRLRVVGAGHSFNAGLVSDGATLSLDRYAGILHIDQETRRVRAKAGSRVRDVNRALWAEGLAIKALPSHDAQSLAGIISTDVHGTGRDVGFVSSSVVAIRVVDGRGEVHAAEVGDELFRCAIGGIGAVGVIIEVTLECVPTFNLRQATEKVSMTWARANTRRALAEHHHASFYVFPFSETALLHTWNRTTDATSFLGGARELFSISVAALSAAWAGALMAHTGTLRLLNRFAVRFQANTELVLKSYAGFNRTVYHLHEELEFAVPAADVWAVTDHLIERYEALYTAKMPYLIVELRFTPAGHQRAMIGPGVERETAWINLCLNQSGDYDSYYAEVEAYLRTIDARPHPGKFCETLDAEDLARAHGERWRRFQRVRARHDPDGRFLNPFTQRLLGPVQPPAQGGHEE